jgi:hypothetical protein
VKVFRNRGGADFPSEADQTLGIASLQGSNFFSLGGADFNDDRTLDLVVAKANTGVILVLTGEIVATHHTVKVAANQTAGGILFGLSGHLAHGQYDVNGDGSVNLADLIEWVQNARTLGIPKPMNELPPARPPYLDVNSDESFTISDLVDLVSELRLRLSGAGEAEETEAVASDTANRGAAGRPFVGSASSRLMGEPAVRPSVVTKPNRNVETRPMDTNGRRMSSQGSKGTQTKPARMRSPIDLDEALNAIVLDVNSALFAPKGR